jgi:hypothetical protein
VSQSGSTMPITSYHLFGAAATRNPQVDVQAARVEMTARRHERRGERVPAATSVAANGTRTRWSSPIFARSAPRASFGNV